MKKIVAGLTLALALTACGTQVNFPAVDLTQAVRVPDVEAALPALQDLKYTPQSSAGGIRAQALAPWTGPRTFGAFYQVRTANPQLGVNQRGEVYVNTVYSLSGGVWQGLVRGFNATGTSLGTGTTAGTKSQSGMAVTPDYEFGDPFDSVWHVQETPSSNLPATVVFPRWFHDDSTNQTGSRKAMEVPNGIRVDPTGFYDLESKARGIAFLAGTPPSQRYVGLYEASASSSASIINRVTPVLYPQDLTGFDPEKVQMDFSMDNVGRMYVVMAFPQNGCVTVACPSLINVQQVYNGVTQWSRVWKTDQPTKLRHVSANSADVVILMTTGATDPETIAGQSEITWVRNDGFVELRNRVPLELWRNNWVPGGTPAQQYAVIPNLKYIQTDNAKRLVVTSDNFIFSGSFYEGYSSVYILNEVNAPANRGVFKGPAVFNGDYVYAAGVTTNNLGQPVAGEDNTKFFLLPFDFRLNPR